MTATSPSGIAAALPDLQRGVARRIAAAAPASAIVATAGLQRPLDSPAASTLLRRAVANALDAHRATWLALIASRLATSGEPSNGDAGQVASARHSLTLALVRMVIAEIGRALQRAAGSEASRNALKRAASQLLDQMEGWRPSPVVDARAGVTTAPTTPEPWPPFAPNHLAPATTRRKERRRGRLSADDDDERSAAQSHTPASAAGADAAAPDEEAPLMDIVAWLCRHDFRADYAHLDGEAYGALPIGRVVDDSA